MFRILGVFAILAALMTAAFASAATLGVEGAVVQAGGDNTLYCATDDIRVYSYQLNDHVTPFDVSGVSLTNVPAACNGARLGFVLYDASGNPLAVSKAKSHPPSGGQAWAAVNGDATTVYIFDLMKNHGAPVMAAGNGVPAEEIEEIRIWIEGSGE